MQEFERFNERLYDCAIQVICCSRLSEQSTNHF
nr:MAG TPA: hypothetical protein [Caudoviricetes sp.]DAU99012.1 MAG TPA: hypothetical protein [Bacteriophage sp.]DAM19191.1 MAG TPA: hypothetical protein [Caudoviricetes sp.]DAQ59428.1 MAG TPA: hypothetical protein [Caudoviricetes sp.]DAU18834.1 MAG TPA: hypothetical protein [Caudoviricetes sp.]